MKIRSHLECKRGNGEYTGAYVSYGFRKDGSDHNKLVVDPVAGENVKLIFRWKLNGMSNSRIAEKRYKKWSVSLCEQSFAGSSACRNPGNIKYRWGRSENGGKERKKQGMQSGRQDSGLKVLKMQEVYFSAQKEKFSVVLSVLCLKRYGCMKGNVWSFLSSIRIKWRKFILSGATDPVIFIFPDKEKLLPALYIVTHKHLLAGNRIAFRNSTVHGKPCISGSPEQQGSCRKICQGFCRYLCI